MKSSCIAAACCCAILWLATAASAQTIVTIEPPEADFFSKKLLCHGVPIKAHKDVSDAALREANRRIGRMLEHLPVAAENLAAAGSELQIIGKDQQVSDLPELRKYKGKTWSTDKNGKTQTIDERTRGVGGLQASCGEENLLRLPSDRYRDHRDICSHEFAHTLLRYGLSENVRELVRKQYADSTIKGLWKGAYAGSNYDEFFAELTMWYFGSRGDYGQLDPKPTEGPKWLKQYDPEAFAMIEQIYSGNVTVKPTRAAKGATRTAT